MPITFNLTIMAITPKKKKARTDLKSEFLAELSERYTYWKDKPEEEAEEYALAYERMIHGLTAPEEEDK